ncbi:LacI family DNA-binding transcriptional regulator [Pseudonocardia sp. C8]|uniref:LacI family DNA-binding transcriptional regulator n=1 Tax=Pseudonocardia sp. C8 TaxID=2762759 RepID=UPI00351BFE74
MTGGTPTRRLRLEDVAAEVGLSTASVSMVLRGVPGPSAATRERVLDAARRLGYRPDRAASLLASRRTGLIGVVLEVRSTFHAELAEELLVVADRRGHDVLLGARTRVRDERRAVETLIDSRCEALVLLGTEAPTARLAELGGQVPVVAVGRRLPGAEVDVVRVDDERGTAELVGHLVAAGHRDIVYVDGGRDAIATDRRRGYRAAMRRAGLGDRARVLRGGKGEQDGARAAAELLAGDALPTAVVVFNDHAAVGLLDALVRAGVDVPGDVSVAGYDDSPLSRMAHVDLTTVSQNVAELSAHTLELVAERLDDAGRPAREVVIPPRLVVRGSTAAPR